MKTDQSSHHVSTLRDYLRVVRRRKWIIVLAVLLVPAAAIGFSVRQQPLYRATAEVLISHQNLANSLTGTVDPTMYQQPDRLAQTQADLARVPQVAQRVLNAVGLHDRSAQDFLASSTASAKQNADILALTVTDRDPALARRLATAYAKEFALYKQRLDTAALEKARVEVESRMGTACASPTDKSQLCQDLASSEQKLRTMEALVGSASVVRTADRTDQVQPKPIRNGLLGFVLGLVFGFGLAFLWEALDTRVRTAEEIGERLGLPLLARLPEPPRKLRRADRLVMLVSPRGVQAESFRMLRTNLEFVRLDRDVKTVMITSSVEQEGKSTTVANLAVALARGGQKVALVDLDLRRPFLDRFFDLRFRPGLTQVALGHAELEEALIPIAITDPETEAKAEQLAANGNGHANGNGNGNGLVKAAGLLQVLIAGPTPPNAGEFVGSRALEEIIGDLRERFDIVLVDAPPSLQVGDALLLSSKVDAVMVVTRMNVVRRNMLSELKRMLDRCPAEKLGFIVTGAEAEEGYGYAAYYYGSYAREMEKEHVA
jgi:Mrp family chromosome partitioning ATPase/capsular polysaccharide biosynthesis protein